MLPVNQTDTDLRRLQITALLPGKHTDKIVTVTVYLAVSCLVPYIPLFIQHLGLNASENGLIFGALPFIAMFSKPLTGGFADKYLAPTILLRIFSVVQLLFMFSIYFVPTIKDPETRFILQDVPCHENGSLINYVAPGSGNLSYLLTGNFTCALDRLNTSDVNASTDHGLVLPENNTCNCVWELYASASDSTLIRWIPQFWITGLLLIIGWYGYGAVVTLQDSMAFKVVENSPVRTTYGANRVLGTMGWAIFALIVGFLLDTFSEASTTEQDRDFTPAFATFAATAVVGLICTFFIQKQKPVETEKLMVSVTRRLMTFDVMLFVAGTFVGGICSGLLYGYLAWYQTELGGGKLLVGITVFVQCCYEAPMMAISGWIIKKLGYHTCMMMALLTFGIRFVGYYAMVDPWFVLLIDIVHSVGFGLFYAVMTNFAFEKAPPGCAATLQGILGATYEGFGQGIGGIAAGFLYHKYGGKLTWLGYGVFAFAASLFYGAAGIYSSKLTKHTKEIVITPEMESLGDNVEKL